MNLTRYINELNKIKLLDYETEMNLWKYYKEMGDISARKKLIESYQPLVFKLAMPFSHMESVMDVIQEGTVGLIEAVESYDYKKGVAFCVFATHRIRGQMYSYLKREGKADIACLEEEYDGGYTGQDLIADTGMAVGEIVELNEVVGKVRQAMDRLPAKEREVLSGVYMQCREVKSVANEMNVSTSHIYRLQKSGVRRIRGMLSNFMHHWK